MPRRRPILLALLACLVLLVPAALAPRGVAAHAFLKRTTPAHGGVVSANIGEVRLTFTEPVEARPDGVTVTDAGGRRVDVRDAAPVPGDATTVGVSLPQQLPNGVYTVRYAFLSADTHPVNGSFRFGVGVSPADVLDGAPAAPAADAAGARIDGPVVLGAFGRGLNLLGLALLLGPIAFRLFVLGRPRSRGDADPAQPIAPILARRLFERRLLRWAWLAVLVLTVAQITSLLAVAVAGSLAAPGAALSPAALTGALTTRFGTLWFARLGLLLVAALVLPLIAAEYDVREEEPDLPPSPWAARGWWAILGAGAGLTALTALGGHAATTPPVALSLLVDWAHLAAATLWIGGLLALALLLPPVLRSLGPADGNAVLAAVAPRFSSLALAGVVTLVLTGFYQTWAQVAAPAALTTTPYGRTLLVKLALVLPLIALAAVNRSVILPRLRRLAGAAGDDRDEGAVAATTRGLRRTVGGEALLGVAVLLTVGLLTALPPARGPEVAAAGATDATAAGATASPNEVTLAANAGELLLTLTIGPTENGPAVLSATLQGPLGEPVEDATVRLRLFPPDGAAPLEVALTARGGRYFGLGDLAPDGRWRIEADVARPAGPVATARFALDLPSGGARVLLAEADRAMNRLTSARERQVLTDGRSMLTTEYEFVAPDRMHSRTSGGGETIAIGDRRFDRAAGGSWSATTWPAPGGYRWPRFDYARTATDVTLLGREDLDGVSCWLVTFYDAEEGARYTFWIGERDSLVRRQAMFYTGHYMDSRFSDFNAPLTIEAP